MCIRDRHKAFSVERVNYNHPIGCHQIYHNHSMTGKEWSDFINYTGSNSVVGLYNNKIVAYGSVVIENKVRGEVAGHIEDIVVDSEVRGKMIGVSLIKELIKVAENKGCYRITLFCKETLVNFYGRNGFEVNNVVMKKYL